MIESVILLRVLHRHNVANVLHDANRRGVATTIGAYRTYVCIAYVMTYAAMLHLLAQPCDCRGKTVNFIFCATQQVEHKPQGCLATYARQLRELAHCLFEQL